MSRTAWAGRWRRRKRLDSPPARAPRAALQPRHLWAGAFAALAGAGHRDHPGRPAASALILTGSPVAGRFTFPATGRPRAPARCDQAAGRHYVSRPLGWISTTPRPARGPDPVGPQHYNPDLLIVDKEPTGFRGELLPTLDQLLERAIPSWFWACATFWTNPRFWPTNGSAKARWSDRRPITTKFGSMACSRFMTPPAALSSARRAQPDISPAICAAIGRTRPPPEESYILITPGGGGDGKAMVNLVLSAYEQDPTLPARHPGLWPVPVG